MARQILNQTSAATTCITLVFLLCSTRATNEYQDRSSPYSKTSSCVKIPDNLKLCRNLAYKEMKLPNLLDHETMDEVKQQTLSWVPLLRKNCHPDLQRFLCSLFAPVCLESSPLPIYPCKSLCERVKNACEPVMIRAGYPWPGMLSCDPLPQNEMCIKPEHHQGGVQSTNYSIEHNTSTISIPVPTVNNAICSPCDNPLDSEIVQDHFCASEFVLKVKIRTIKKAKKDRKLYTERRRRIVYKTGPLRKKDLRKLTLIVQNGGECSCPQLEEKQNRIKKDFFLVMGRKLNRKLLVTVLHRWPRKLKSLRRLSKKFKEKFCS